MYSSHDRQAASSLDHDSTVGCEGEVTGDRWEDVLLISVRAERMRAVRSSSISEASFSSAVVGANRAETEGADTHDGGPSESE